MWNWGQLTVGTAKWHGFGKYMGEIVNLKTLVMKTQLRNTSVMKRIIPIVAAAVMVTACNTSPKPATTDNSKVVYMDTTGLAQFQAWKAQNELATMNGYMGAQPAVQSNSGSMSSTSSNTARRSSSSTVRRSSGSTASTSSGRTVTQKKGWSKAAKGAVIGGVAGAAGGAIINKKNRAVGAVIGGVLGAAGGYGIGRGMDKRDGRY